MSTLMNITEKCAVCGKESRQTILSSTNTFGSPDLDLRPAEMMRSTMYFWIRECPHCGYVSKSLEDNTCVDISWLKENEYIGCSGYNFLSKLAAGFYKLYLINKADDKPEDAFYAILHAAWACDDKNDADNAVLCRKLAIEELNVIIGENSSDPDIKVQRVDLMRRAGMFHEAVEECRNLSVEDELLKKILAFEMERAKDEDDKCYTVEDATK